MTIARAQVQALQVQFPYLAERVGQLVQTARRVLGRPYRSCFGILRHWAPCHGEAFIDIGSYRGDTIEAMRLYHRETPLHAFEPNPHLAVNLAHRYGDDPNLVVYGCGLSDTESTARLYVPVYGDCVFEQYASFHAGYGKTILSTQAVFGFNSERLELMACDAKLFSLDEVGLQAGLIKFSRTGMDEQIIKGAKETLKSCQPLVIASLEPGIRSLLENGLDFAPAIYRKGRLFTPSADDLFAIYVPPKRLKSLDAMGLV